MSFMELMREHHDISYVNDCIEEDIINMLISFCNHHDQFHSFTKRVDTTDYIDDGTNGSFCRLTGEVTIRKALVEDLPRSLAINIGVDRLSQLITTMLHEHRHAYQRKWKIDQHIPTVDHNVDFKGYWNHPREVDAREASKEYHDEAVVYLIGCFRKKYLPNTIKTLNI